METPTLPLPPYATFSADELASADRMEAQYNAAHRRDRAIAAENAGHSVRYATDGSLRRLAKFYARRLEDIDEGDRTVSAAHRRLLVAQQRDIEREQDFRAALAESWLATEDGTDCYTAFQGRGGLAAVLDGSATPASYDLAVTLDWEHWKCGLPHVLDWRS